MTKVLLVEYWMTRMGVFARIPDWDLCLSADSLHELSARIETQGEALSGLQLVPGQESPEEILP